MQHSGHSAGHAAPEFRGLKSVEEFDAILGWFYEATGCRNIHDLGKSLGVSPASISDARRRLRVPEAWFRLGGQTDAIEAPRQARQ